MVYCSHGRFVVFNHLLGFPVFSANEIIACTDLFGWEMCRGNYFIGKRSKHIFVRSSSDDAKNRQ